MRILILCVLVVAKNGALVEARRRLIECWRGIELLLTAFPPRRLIAVDHLLKRGYGDQRDRYRFAVGPWSLGRNHRKS
jgi:hypothetical protein